PSKFRSLKRYATQASVSGLQGEQKFADTHEQNVINLFLEITKGLRYLDFHHLDTKSLSTNLNNNIRLANSKLGLHEGENMNKLVKVLNTIGEKQWFRKQIGMTRGNLLSFLFSY
ncbi:hypothetical protein BYT27DRAFT_7112265, partial [Phlegmacium glaucopus]